VAAQGGQDFFAAWAAGGAEPTPGPLAFDLRDRRPGCLGFFDAKPPRVEGAIFPTPGDDGLDLRLHGPGQWDELFRKGIQ